jgi:hypothetical protein
MEAGKREREAFESTTLVECENSKSTIQNLSENIHQQQLRISQLQEMSSLKEKEIETCRKERESFESERLKEVENSTSTIQKLTESVVELQMQVEKLRAVILDKENDIEQNRKGRLEIEQVLSKEIDNSRLAIKKLTNDLEISGKQIEELKSLNSAQLNLTQVLQGNVSDLNESLDQKGVVEKELQSQLSKLKERREREVQQLHQNIEDLKKEFFASSSAEQSQLNQLLIDKQNRIDAILKERDDLSENLSQQLISAKQRDEKITMEIQALQNTIVELKEKENQSTSEQLLSNSRIDELRKEKNELVNEKAALSEGLQQQLIVSNERYTKNELEIRNFRISLTELEQKVLFLEKEKQDLSELHNAELIERSKEIQSVNGRLEEALNEKEIATKEAIDARACGEKAQQEVLSLTKSAADLSGESDSKVLDLNRALIASESRIAELLKEKETSEIEWNKRSEQTDSQRNDLEQKFQDSQNEVDKLTVSLADLRKEFESREREISEKLNDDSEQSLSRANEDLRNACEVENQLRLQIADYIQLFEKSKLELEQLIPKLKAFDENEIELRMQLKELNDSKASERELLIEERDQARNELEIFQFQAQQEAMEANDKAIRYLEDISRLTKWNEEMKRNLSASGNTNVELLKKEALDAVERLVHVENAYRASLGMGLVLISFFHSYSCF